MRNSTPCSLGVSGYGAAVWTTARRLSPSSYPPGARRSSRTIPPAITEDSWVRAPMASKTSAGRSCRAATAWRIPVPSLSSRKWIAPLLRRLYTQPRTSTSAAT